MARSLPLLVIALLVACGAEHPDRTTTVTATRGDVVRVAIATGRLTPDRETVVTSENGGVLTALHVALGDRVTAGQLLAEVRPRVTAATLLEAERGLVAAREGEAAAREFAGGEHVAAWLLRAMQGKDTAARMLAAATRAREAAELRLELLREGRAAVADRDLDWGVRAPVAGRVLALPVRAGQPVVPASIYGQGTELIVLGDLDRPVFRGTVPETEVGRLTVGMPAVVTIAALPGIELAGELVEIGLRGEDRDASVVFPVRIAVDAADGVLLRSGYSATAELVLERATDAVVLPERLVEYRDDGAFVLVPGPAGTATEREVETGVSDGIRVAIVDGLAVGEPVVERDWSIR